MLLIRKLFLLVALVVLAAGPVLAAPLARSPVHAVNAAPSSKALRALTTALVYGLSIGVFGITIRKDVGAIAAKYVTRAGAASGDYKDGVSGAGGAWEAAAAGAESNWEQGTQAAMTAKRFAKGVTGKAAKYQQNAVMLGSQRYGPGVANAKDAYARSMGPVISTLSGLSLPPKSFRGSPNNQARANAVAVALAALRSNK